SSDLYLTLTTAYPPGLLPTPLPLNQSCLFTNRLSKYLTKKTKSHHHCSVLHKYRLLSCDNLITFKNCCLMFKIRFDLAPPPLCSLVKFRTETTSATRGAARGDCEIPFLKKVYLDSRFSQLGQPGNGTISHRTLENQPHSTALKKKLKTWLINNQKCDH